MASLPEVAELSSSQEAAEAIAARRQQTLLPTRSARGGPRMDPTTCRDHTALICRASDLSQDQGAGKPLQLLICKYSFISHLGEYVKD